MARDLDVEDLVHFTGTAPDDLVAELMSSASVGLSPDPKNPLNDVSTMNKTMEYMAFGLPVVAFDLVETRVSAEDAAVYAEPNDVGDYVRALVELLDAPDRRQRMARAGRERVEHALAWSKQRPAYLRVYKSVTAHGASIPANVVPLHPEEVASRREDAASPALTTAAIRRLAISVDAVPDVAIRAAANGESHSIYRAGP